MRGDMMGAWSTSIFSDDLACGVRDMYKELIGDGKEGREATKILLEIYNPRKIDSEDYTVFWLSLAAIQWRLGRLEYKVKKRAIEIIDSDMNLVLWIGEEVLKSDYNKREKVLLKLKVQLLSPQPKTKKVKKVTKYYTDFEVGDAFSYEFELGKYVILKVVEILEDLSGSYPVCEVCDWVGEVLPSFEEVSELKPRINRFGELQDIVISEYKKNDIPKSIITIISKELNVTKKNNGTPFIWWSELNEYLSDCYGFETIN